MTNILERSLLAITIWGWLACNCSAEEIFWHASTGEMEFGLTAKVGGTAEQMPSLLQTGYDGAWVFGGLQNYGVGQTFTVPSVRTLQSIELRVAGFNNQQISGDFRLAIYQFDSLSGVPSQELASLLVDGGGFWQIELDQTPVSSFDFSSFNVLLLPDQLYALAVTATPSFTGGFLTLQSAKDIYPEGNVYMLSTVPEPGPSALFGLGAGLMVRAMRTRHRRLRANSKENTMGVPGLITDRA